MQANTEKKKWSEVSPVFVLERRGRGSVSYDMRRGLRIDDKTRWNHLRIYFRLAIDRVSTVSEGLSVRTPETRTACVHTVTPWHVMRAKMNN